MKLVKKYRIYLLFVLAATLFIFLGYYLGQVKSRESRKLIKNIRHQKNINLQYRYINPLLECALSEPNSSGEKKIRKRNQLYN